MKDKVTVVTVSYNADKVIEPTIKSVVNQTYPNLEYVIIDGSSTDNTLNIIKKYSNKISAWYSEPDRGIYDGMNKGLDVATGDWIIFMNAGDRFLHKNVLKDFFEEKEWGDNTAVIYGNSYKTNGILAKKEVVNSPFWKNKSYLHGSGICHQASFVKRSVAIQYPFNLKFKHAADMKMFNDIYYAGYKFEYLQETVCLFDITDSFGKRNPWSGIRNTFAASYDLVNWTDWKGADLIIPSKNYDELFAHKSYVVKHDGVVYHFYCAVNNAEQRGIAIATSKPMGRSAVRFPVPESKNRRQIMTLNEGWKTWITEA